MPQPTPGDVHVNAPLTNISVAYLQQAGTIADQVFPQVPVMKQSDKYYQYDKGDWNRIGMQVRAPGTESAGSGWRVTSDNTYFCDSWAIHKDVDDDTRANQDGPIDMDRDATIFVTQQAALRRDKQWASKYFKTGVWTGASTGTDIVPGTLWSASSSDPISDITNQGIAIKEKTGFKPNKLVLGAKTFNALRQNAAILDRIKYTMKGVVTADLLAGLFDVEQVLIADTMEVTSAEGAASTTTSFIFGKHALLVYAAKTPSLMLPSGGYTFVWSGKMGMNAGIRIKRFRMEALNSDRIEAEAAFDCKLVAADVGAFFNGAVA
jgi:hypothetical protein